MSVKKSGKGKPEKTDAEEEASKVSGNTVDVLLI